MSKHSRWIKKAERWTWNTTKWAAKEAFKPKNIKKAFKVTTSLAGDGTAAVLAVKALKSAIES